MRFRIGLVLALALGLTPGWATADGTPSRTERVAAYDAMRGRLARRLPTLDPRFAEAIAGSDDAYLLRGADFDGDGAEEVVDARLHSDEDATTGAYTQTVRLDVRRGRDGALLWSKSIGTASYVFPVFAKVGADGRMGVVVASYDATYVDGLVAGGGVESTTVTTFDGKGTQVWTQTFRGGGAYSEAGSGSSTYVDGVMNANPGGGDEVLVSAEPTTYAYDPTYTASAATTTVVPAILDGATGQPRVLPPVPTTSPIAWAAPVPDLNKDGRDDVVVAGSATVTTSLVALRSSDGAVLWAARDLPSAEASYPQSVGDVTGDGVADVTVAAAPYTAGPVMDFQDPKVSLVNGATGALAWTKNGSHAIPIGNADRKAGGELVIGDWLDAGKTFGFKVTAYNAAGQAVWSSQRSVSADGLDSFMARATYGAIGDTNGDGASEIGFSITLTGKVHRANEGTIDGRTGRARRDPVSGMFATQLTLDGRGTDGYHAEQKKNVLRVTGFRGDDGRKLWGVAFAVKGTANTNATPLYAGKDRCGDLAIGVRDGATTTHYVLSGATGRPLWALSRSGQGAGKVTRPAVRSAQVFVSSCS